MTEEQNQDQAVRTLRGRVSSSKMDKTITVVVEHKEKHALYGKYVRRQTKLHAHDEENTCNEGDLVRIVQCRPLSKNKSWRLHDVVERSED